MEKSISKAGMAFMVMAIPLLLLSILIVSFSITGVFLWWLTIPITVTGIGYFVKFLFESKTGRESRYILPLTCLLITVITVIIGVICYINDHEMFMRGLEAQLIWFFISIPSFAAAIINFIIAVVKTNKELEKLKNQN